MAEREQIDKPLRDLIEIIHFTEDVSAKILGVPDEAAIYRAVMEEFAQSKRYTASILLLTDGGSKLRIVETSIPPGKLKAGEKAAGVRLKGYQIDLNKSNTHSQVVREGKTVQVNVNDIIGELFPRPLAHLISKTMGYEKTPSILTPLKRHGKIIGALAISSTELAERFIPSVRNLAQHISNALELVYEYAERKRAEEELRKYRDHLEELVEERTAELRAINESLQREITERKRAEEALRESEEELRAIFDGVGDGIALIDVTGKVVRVNKRITDIGGYAEEEIVGKRFELLKMFPPQSLAKMLSNFTKLISGQQIPPFEVEVYTKAGEKMNVELRGSLLRQRGKTVGMVGVMRDITERKRAEETLQASQIELSTIFDHAPVAMIVVDRERRVRKANRAAVEFTNRPAEEMIGLRGGEALRCLHSLDDPKGCGFGPFCETCTVRRIVLDTFETGDSHHQVEAKLPFARGEEREEMNLLVSTTLLNVSEGHMVLVCVEDTTERKRAEEALSRWAEELAALQATVLDITASHDLPTLLQTIVERAAHLLNASGGGLYLCEPEQEEARCVVSYNTPRDYTGTVLKYGEGAAGTVAQTGEPLIIDDYRTWSRRAAVYEKEQPFTAVLSAPMIWQGQVIGVIHVLHDVGIRQFTQADLELLTLFANHAAIAVENTRLYEAEQKRHHIAETLRQASTILSSTLELDKVLGLILQQLRQVIPYDSASLQQLQDEHLEIVACQGFESPDKVVGLVFPLEPKFPNCRVVTTKVALAIEDVSQEYPHFKDEANSYESGRIRSWLGVPLMVRDQVIGMIALDRTEVRPYTAEESELVMAFANQAAIAIENARLYQAVQRELAERNRLEQEIEERRLYLESVLACAPDAIVTLDAQHKLLEWNSGAERLFGYTLEEAVGRNIDELITGSDAKVFEEATGFTRRVLSRESVPPAETVRYRKDGSPVDVIVSGSPILIGNEIVGVVAVYTDITERKRAGEALRESEDRYRRLFEDSPISLWEEDFSAVKTHLDRLRDEGVRDFRTYLENHPEAVVQYAKMVKVIDVNKATIELYQVESKDALRGDLTKAFAPETFNAFREELVAIAEGKTSFESETIAETLAGEEKHTILRWSVAPGHEETFSRVLVSITDITERKQLETQLLQLQKMDAIGQLAAGIAHDFNNLLTPIGGFSELLLWKAPKGSQQQEYLRQIQVAADRAAALTRQLRLFTRQTAGERHPLQLNSLVEETRTLLERSFPKEIAIELRLASELWAVEADPSQISQVLMNLCLNARDAMPNGGTLTLETRNVALDEEYARIVLEAQPGRYVRLSVSDTGCGMSLEVQARLFEPFFTTKEVGEGAGLGLAVVYGIVKGHGGFIRVYSQEGQGSTFHVYLPAIGRAVEEREVAGLELPSGTEAVLVVDDEEAVRALGQRVLEHCGYTVLTAEDGVQALEVYQAHQGEIALVVLDVVMPQMGGQECLRRLRELNPQVKVLISTGYTAKDLAQELVAEGALGVVEKPFRLQDFATAVRRGLDER